MKIVAVIVTWNRRALLERCLESVLGQTHAVDAVVVIDNASDDGTAEFLHHRCSTNARISIRRMARNIGGAGGFHAGIAQAYDDGADWIWVMDDDTIPAPDALRALIDAIRPYPPFMAPWLLASRVEWEDQRLHPMNHIAVKQRYHKEYLWHAAAHGHLSIRAATFVSLLIDRRCVAYYGLPLADYFIWNDDVEYTARILRHQPGIAVPASIVLHATARPYGTHDAVPARYYFFLRNQLWMLMWSDSHDRMEKFQIFQMWALKSMDYLLRHVFFPDAWWIFAKAAFECCSRRPRRHGEPRRHGPAPCFEDGSWLRGGRT